MAESGPDGEFKVTDRRRRVEEDDPTTPAAHGDIRASAPQESAPPLREPEPWVPEGAHAAADGERGLEGLFVMLASSAVVALGEAVDPATGQSRRDPGAAADAIDLLVLLREKTDGHRTPRETQLLDELIYDLQLRYVAATKPRL